ncbi:MAG: AAA family ATPase [Anaerolineae bacterium]|nr:AAA family ATPase [Anaerolineae bacterium]
MAHLALYLLGAFRALLDGEPVTEFESTKVRALLAYLAVEAHHPHRRESLTGLLWSEYSEYNARRNLRRALSNLRAALHDRDAVSPFLLVTYEALQFNTESDYILDVQAFRTAVGVSSKDPPVHQALEEALALYKDDFLVGFSLKDSPAFEDWILIVRERLQRQAATVLQCLVAHYERLGYYDRACDYAWRQVELERWQEQAHRQLMRVLALNGQRSAALAQYEVCCTLLRDELDVQPAYKTTQLYEQIRDGEFPLLSQSVSLGSSISCPPTFLAREVVSETPVFVAREPELAWLDTALDAALMGHGRVVFVTGEAGQGKTALIQAFVARALARVPNLVVADGHCNAYIGVGDPYLPFREIMEMFTVDIEAQYTAGAITKTHAQRLWNVFPLMVQCLVTEGLELIGTFVSGLPLLRRAVACIRGNVNWLDRLRARIDAKASVAGHLQQETLFAQFTTVLQMIARQVPLLLIIDDMQWADLGSIGLLFHLGRRLKGCRILLVGAYRSEEVALGRNGTRHPLEAVVHELQQIGGDILIDLEDTDNEYFVQALLDSEPHCLGNEFRNKLYQQTEGHPLFTLELLRGMQERGNLIQNAKGQWSEGPVLDWDTLPVRVEAAIAERIHRLPARLQEILCAASVEGEVFTAEVVARVQQTDLHDLVTCLSNTLGHRHHLVRAEGFQQVNGQRLLRYRFQHILFQKYLYDSLDEVELGHLHSSVGSEIETLFKEHTEDVAIQLARHFQAAGLSIKAVYYLHQAAEGAIRLSAYEEAVAHLNKGLELLKMLPGNAARAQQELNTLSALGSALTAIKGYASPEVEQTYNRARELCEQIGETPQLFPVLSGLWIYYLVRCELQTAYALGEQLLRRAQNAQNLLFRVAALWSLGGTSFFLGELESSRKQLEQCLALYDPEAHHSLLFIAGQDPGLYAYSYIANTLWLLGYPTQALRQSQCALTLARELDHPYSLATVCSLSAVFYQLRGDVQTALELAEATIRLSFEHGFTQWIAHGIIIRGWALAQRGQGGEAIVAQMREAMDAWRATGAGVGRTYYLCLLAEIYAAFGQFEEGLALLDEGFAIAHSGGERWAMAELYRLKGEFLLAQGAAEIEVEVCFHQSLDIACQQRAKSWELRAMMSLSRLWQKQGKEKQAYQMLAEVYNWFTEGFDTCDLQEAQALLHAL